MNLRKQFVSFALLPLVILALSTCGGGGSSDSDDEKERECRESSTNYGLTAFELLNPTPCDYDRFGDRIIVLSNGNVLVSDTLEPTFGSYSTTVHLFNPLTQELIWSRQDINFDDIRVFPGGNFIVQSSFVGENEQRKSAVKLMNGQTGIQIGKTITVDTLNGITPLVNNKFVITSPDSSETSSGFINGSVVLVDGSTGIQISNTIVVDRIRKSFGDGGTAALNNGNFVVISQSGRIESPDRGSMKLFDGDTGVLIGDILTRDNPGDPLEPITEISIFYGPDNIINIGNSNFAISYPSKSKNGIQGVGSVILVNGDTGEQIGSVFTGDDEFDHLGRGITVLSNGNFVISSQDDDDNGIINAGTVRLVDGVTGALVGSVMSGDQVDDRFGHSGSILESGGITALPNGNFVIASESDDHNGIEDAGTVMLVNGTTGALIGGVLSGDSVGDSLGYHGVKALSNGNFVIGSPFDDVGAEVNAGSVILVNGTTGMQIGNAIVGSDDEKLGSIVVVLPNGNFVASFYIDEDNSNAFILGDGTTGRQIGETIRAEFKFEYLGSAGVFALSNNNFVIATRDVNNDTDTTGSIRLVDGETGQKIGQPIVGKNKFDFFFYIDIVDLENTDFIILSLPGADTNGLQDSGFVGVFPKQ